MRIAPAVVMPGLPILGSTSSSSFPTPFGVFVLLAEAGRRKRVRAPAVRVASLSGSVSSLACSEDRQRRYY